MKIAKREADKWQGTAAALSQGQLPVDQWMCDRRRVGTQLSLAWSRHIALPRWRYLHGRDDSGFAGTLLLFCSDSLHPFEPERPGFAQMCYGFPRDVIVLGVRRSDRALLELVPRPDQERRLLQAAVNAPDFVLSAILGLGRWRLCDAWRGFLLGPFSHGFGMACVQHAHMYRVMLDRVDPRTLPQPLERIETELHRREVRVLRQGRRRLLELLDPQVVRSVRKTNAFLTPATYNLVATAQGETRALRLAALKTYPGVLPAFVAKDPPLPGIADVLAYYESGSDQTFRALSRFLLAAVDRGEVLSPFFSRPFEAHPDVIRVLREVPRIVLWRIGAWGMHALLRTVHAVPAEQRPRTAGDWMALRDIAVVVAALAEAFGDLCEDASAQFWNGPVLHFLGWASVQGWAMAAEAVRDPSGDGSAAWGIERALLATQDVARAQGIHGDSALEDLAQLAVPQLIAWNRGWQVRIEDHHRRVETRSLMSNR